MPPFQPRRAETSAKSAEIVRREDELNRVSEMVRSTMELLCPNPGDPAYVHIPRPKREDTDIRRSIKALYVDPRHTEEVIDGVPVKMTTRAWLKRYTKDEGDPIYVMVDRVPLLAISIIGENKRPGAGVGYSHARVFADGTVEFNPAIYGQNPSIERREELMGYVVDTLLIVEEQQALGIARMAAPARGTEEFYE